MGGRSTRMAESVPETERAVMADSETRPARASLEEDDFFSLLFDLSAVEWRRERDDSLLDHGSTSRVKYFVPPARR